MNVNPSTQKAANTWCTPISMSHAIRLLSQIMCIHNLKFDDLSPWWSVLHVTFTCLLLGSPVWQFRSFSPSWKSKCRSTWAIPPSLCCLAHMSCCACSSVALLTNVHFSSSLSATVQKHTKRKRKVMTKS